MWWMISQKSQQKMSKPSSKSNFFPFKMAIKWLTLYGKEGCYDNFRPCKADVPGRGDEYRCLS